MSKESDYEEIGILCADIAYTIFKECGAEKDFCVQTVGSAVVFGGTNRLKFSFRQGWYADESYCSKVFLDKWNDIKDAYC